ncbi:MAG: site-2 protease family protein [Gemmatimonadota bacterium]
MGGFRLGRWFGFEIRIDYSWFLVFGLVVWTFSANEFPAQLPGYGSGVYYAMGILGGLVFFLSVLLHELAHSAVARTRGIQVEGITLFIFGGVAQTRMEAERAIDEFLLTVVGPLSSLALAAIFYALGRGVEALGWPAPIATVASFLALLNLVLAVFNMLPGFPLDGGRIFRSIVWYVTGDIAKATRWATSGGRLFGYLLIAFGIFQLYAGYFLGGLWSAFIGWFLANAARASYRQFDWRRTLSRIPVGRVMVEHPPVVPPEMPVRQLVEELFMRRPDAGYPVVSDSAVLGLVAVDDVAGLAPEARGGTTVAALMRRIPDVPVATSTETLDQVVARLGADDRTPVLVIDDGRLVGLLTLTEIARWVKRARDLGMG